MTYRNIHTNKVCKVLRIEFVSNPPIQVYVLSDGNRWDKKQFDEHWQKIEDTPAQEIDPT